MTDYDPTPAGELRRLRLDDPDGHPARLVRAVRALSRDELAELAEWAAAGARDLHAGGRPALGGVLAYLAGLTLDAADPDATDPKATP